MAKNICITRIKNLLKKSSIKTVKREEIINTIETVMAEKKLSSISEVDVDVVAKDVTSQMKLQKQKDKINAIKDEIIVRKYQEKILTNFDGNEFEGLASILVGSNDQITGARDSVSVAQTSAIANLFLNSLNKMKCMNILRYR